MKGHWKDKRKHRIRDNGKALVHIFEENRGTTPPKLKNRTIPYEYDYEMDISLMYGKPFQGWQYYTIGLDGPSNSKYRAHYRGVLKSEEKADVKKYISEGNWDAVIDHRGMRNTVSWDMY